MTNDKVYNDFWNALSTKMDSMPKSYDKAIKLKLDGLNKLDDYDLMTVKEVKSILKECLAR